MTARLNGFDQDEFRDETRKLWPKGYDFDEAWSRFQAEKRKRGLQ